jgi:hypothetical protein
VYTAARRERHETVIAAWGGAGVNPGKCRDQEDRRPLRWCSALGIFRVERNPLTAGRPRTPRSCYSVTKDGRLIDTMPAKQKKKPAKKSAPKPARKTAAKKPSVSKPKGAKPAGKYEQSGAPWWKKFI